MLSELEKIDQSAKLCMKFVSVEDDMNNCRQIIGAPPLSRRLFKRKKPIKILRIFVYLVIAVFCMTMGSFLSPSVPDIMFNKNHHSNMAVSNFITFIGFIPIIIFVIKTIYSFIATNKAYATAIEQQRRDKENAISRLKILHPQYEELKKQVYDKTICIFPDDYIYGAGYINDLIRNKRADSLKEAINIYEQDMQNLALRSELTSQLNSLGDEMRNVRDEVRDLRDETAYQGEMQRNASRENNRILKREATKNDIRWLNNL